MVSGKRHDGLVPADAPAGEEGDEEGSAGPEREIMAAIAGAEEIPPPSLDDGETQLEPYDGPPVTGGDDQAAAPSESAADKKKRDKSPNKIADDILAEQEFISDRHGTVYRYNGRHWEEATNATLHALAWKFDGARASLAKRRREIADYIKAARHVDHVLGPDFKGEIPWSRVAAHEVAVKNGVLDVKNGVLRPHRSADYLERVLPWDWREGAQCPFWHKALDLWFDDELDCRDALQDFFGYIVLPHAKFKKAAVLHGDPDTGKSRVPLAAKALVGADYTCQLPVDAMDHPVKLEVIIGKGLNLITELPTDAMIKDGGFKTLVSTEEPVFINPKYKPGLTYTPRAKHMIATNILPKVTDKSEATFNRLLIIPFWRPIGGTGDEIDPETFDQTVIAEMQGLLCWAVEGAARLIERHGKFITPARGQAALNDFREAENEVKPFLDEVAIWSPDESVPLSRVTEAFNNWNGKSRRLTPREVGGRLRKAGQIVKKVRVGNQTFMSLVGYRLTGDEAPYTLHVDGADATKPGDEIAGRFNKVDAVAEATADALGAPGSGGLP